MVRIKHRYLVLEVRRTDKRIENAGLSNIKESQLYHNILLTVRHLHGDYGEVAVQPALNLKYVNKKTGLMILRSRLGPHRLLASALPLVKFYRDGSTQVSISISTLYIGACIKQCLLFIKKYQMDEYHKAAISLSEKDREELKTSYMSINLHEDY